MKKQTFPWIALGFGSLVAMVLLRFGPTGDQEDTALPLLTSLFLCEFGFLVTTAGAFMGFRAWLARQTEWMLLLPPIACSALAIGFAWVGLAIWSSSVVS